MKIFRNEDGQTLVLTAICMIGVFGFMGLAIDVGVLFRSRRQMQTAADAAALAAALDYYYNNTTQASPVAHAQTAGKSAAASNGVTDGTNGTVTINCAPTSGPNAGGSCNGYFEALVSSPTGTIFMSTFSAMMGNNNYGSINVSGRAVAGTPVASDACIWITAPSGSNVFQLQGNSSINAPACGINVNSSDPNAVKVTGNSNNFNGPDFNIVGGFSGHQVTPTPMTTGTAPTSPPIPTNLKGPDPTKGDCKITTALTSITTANVGSVTGTATNNVVCFSNAVTLGSGVTLPGAASGVTYLFENGVTIGTGSTVQFGSANYDSVTGAFTGTSGAVMDLYGGTLTQNSNSVLNAYAPTTGTYNGLAIMQPYTNTTTPLQVQFGSNNEYLDGIIYAPGTQVYLQDNGGGVTASGVIANTMFIKSSNLTIPGYSKANQATTPFRIVTLTE
jgi:Flp pilus assembly protein TadG